jgi:hypothetical protein
VDWLDRWLNTRTLYASTAFGGGLFLLGVLVPEFSLGLGWVVNVPAVLVLMTVVDRRGAPYQLIRRVPRLYPD